MSDCGPDSISILSVFALAIRRTRFHFALVPFEEIRPVKHAVLLGMMLVASGGAALHAQQSTPVPNAPLPQAPAPGSLGNLKTTVTPGIGSTAAPSSTPQDTTGGNSSYSSDTSTAPEVPPQQQAPYIPPAGQAPAMLIRIPVNEVVVPVTVKDKKGNMVPGLTWNQFRVYEDNVPQKIVYFTSDPIPLSVAFVVDQSLPSDVMNRVNQSLSAVSGAFSKYDSVAVFGYNSFPHMVTDFTGAKSARLNVALSEAKAPGRDMGVVAPGGPMDDGITENGRPLDPNTTPEHGLNTGWAITPKEYHPLNDAILAAAEDLAKQPRGRRRILYVVSDGKEEGSQASYKEVVRFLLTNNISLYGTLVGSSAIWGVGYMDKFHLPYLPTMRDNILPKYAVATGGSLDSEFSENGMQMSFAKIAASLRGQYTLVYSSHSNILASNFHSIEVRVEGVSGLQIYAPLGYYPAAHNTDQ
jgi:VWFA-related protein